MAIAPRLALLGMALTSLFSAAYAKSDDLTPGAAAPKLDVKSWYKGTPIKEFDADKTYVVEFWATWCGPCKESIPHLSELAKNNPDVTFIGVSVWEDDINGNIQKFVDGMGNKMNYNVGYSGNSEGMAKTWMEAAGQNGIPTAFVVKAGKVVWLGHPMSMDKPLAEIKAGTFDVAAFKTKFDKDVEATRKDMALNKAFQECDVHFKAGKRAEAKVELTKLVAENPNMAQSAEAMRFDWLATEEPKAWENKAIGMAKSKKPQDLQRLSSFALARAQKPEGHELSRKAIGLALANNPKDFNTLWYASNIYAQTKDAKLQLDAVTRLLVLFPDSPAKNSPDFKARLEKDKADLEAKLKAAK